MRAHASRRLREDDFICACASAAWSDTIVYLNPTESLMGVSYHWPLKTRGKYFVIMPSFLQLVFF